VLLLEWLSEPKYVSIGISNRELEQPVGLNSGLVYDIEIHFSKVLVQTDHVTNPEESIPTAALLFHRCDLRRGKNEAKHYREPVTAHNGKLRWVSGRIFTHKPETFLVVGRTLLHVGNGKIGGASDYLRKLFLIHLADVYVITVLDRGKTWFRGDGGAGDKSVPFVSRIMRQGTIQIHAPGVELNHTAP
jgi:hypothetical protein